MLAERIKKIRKARELTQLEFAKRIGVTAGHISQVETGTSIPSNHLVKSICREFNVREKWLLYGESVLSEKDGYTVEEIEDFEADVKKISRVSLYGFLTSSFYTIIEMNNRLSDFQLDVEKIVRAPDKELLEWARNLLNVVDSLKENIFLLVDIISKEKKPGWKTWRGVIEKHFKTETDMQNFMKQIIDNLRTTKESLKRAEESAEKGRE